MKPLLWGVFLLAALTAACVTPTLTPPPTPTATPIPPTPTPAPPVGGVLMRVLPPSVAVAPGALALVSVEVSVDGVGVSAAELTFTFDPKSLRLVGVEPGDLLGESPLVGFKSIDQNVGEARIALARVGKTQNPTPNGNLVLVTLQVLQGAAPGARLPLQLAQLTLVDEAFSPIPQLQLEAGEILVQSP